MKVLYDYQAFHYQEFGGVSKGICEFIGHLPEDIEIEIAIRQSNNVHLKALGIVEGLQPMKFTRKTFLGGVDSRIKNLIYNGLNYFPFYKTPKNINRECSIKALEKGDYDVFVPTFYDTYFLKHIKRPFILEVHDLTNEVMHTDARVDSQVRNRQKLIDKASLFLVPSHNTKKDLERIYNVDSSKIIVLHRGAPDIDDSLFETGPIYSDPYLLFVGARRVPYKNFVPFVKSCSTVIKKYNLKIVCTGEDFSTSEKELFRELGIEDRMICRFFSSEELQRLYHYAKAFVFPSSYEGFGLPVLEAMKCGCPTILNNASCFPEIASDAALYFEMNQSEDNLGEVLENLLVKYEALRPKLVEAGFRRVEMFKWENASANLAEVLRKAAAL